MSLTYTQFITKVGNQQFRKCLNNGLINQKFLYNNNKITHHKFQYKIGLNEDTDSCELGGLYFTTKEHINEYLEYGLNVALLELCKDAKFYIEPNRISFKTNKFIIKEILPQTEELCKIAVKQNPFLLHYVTNQTEELCKLAVQKYGRSLKFVTNQTEELCKLAVLENPSALQFVKEKTPELCALAIKLNKQYHYTNFI
jgi:hypothetical protein